MQSTLEKKSIQNPLAIMGEEDVVAGFSGLGFKVYAIKEKEQLAALLEEVVKQDNLVCLVQDNIYQAIEGLIDTYKNLPFPIFIPFSKNLTFDLLQERIKNIRIKATGAF